MTLPKQLTFSLGKRSIGWLVVMPNQVRSTQHEQEEEN